MTGLDLHNLPTPTTTKGDRPLWEIPHFDDEDEAVKVQSHNGYIYTQQDKEIIITTPEETRELALALLAAANYQEGK